MAYIKSLGTPSSRSTARKALNAIARALGRASPNDIQWESVTRSDAQDVLHALQDKGLAPATQQLYMAVFRGVMHEAWQMELISGDTLERIKTVKPAKATRLPSGRALPVEEVDHLLAQVSRDRRPKGIRDVAIIQILYSSGLRRSELVGIDLEHVIPEENAIRVTGKGDRERLSYLDDEAWDALNEWIDQVRGEDPGPLFLPINKGGKIQWRRMSDQSIASLLGARALEAGIQKTGPHDMRRSFITQLLDNGVDVFTVKEAAGHASVTTTQIYDRRSEEGKRAAVAGLRGRNRKT
ncbi:tyrosine-type recombinase/integrase [Thioalkalivibrio sp. ALE16]|uniref:tyrosine-type recombinase/integrase n=1 Tax=Thioalkalivibrio sp. ALE16 TaxID=1158172 RepID=UPI000363D2A4|nr:tyrosine-type recombinase/integrase [Thioalkalivibrio sp. ALE16]